MFCIEGKNDFSKKSLTFLTFIPILSLENKIKAPSLYLKREYIYMTTAVKEYLFSVITLSDTIRSRYNSNLAWFFDDSHNNPLLYPPGVTSITSDSRNTITVTFVPAAISVDAIISYLSTIGVEALPLKEYRPTPWEKIVGIALYPVMFVVGRITFALLNKRKGPK